MVSKNNADFWCQYEELDMAVATKFVLGSETAAGADSTVRQQQQEVIMARAMIKDLDDTCTRLLEVFTEVEGKVLVFFVPRPLPECNFQRLLKDLTRRNLNEPLLLERTEEVLVRFSPIRLRTAIRLSPPLQAFNAIEMFYRVQNTISPAKNDFQIFEYILRTRPPSKASCSPRAPAWP